MRSSSFLQPQAFDNSNSNTFLEYMMLTSVFDALAQVCLWECVSLTVQLLQESDLDVDLGFDAVLVLTLLVGFKKNEVHVCCCCGIDVADAQPIRTEAWRSE